MKHKETCRMQFRPEPVGSKIREAQPVKFFGLILPFIFLLTGTRNVVSGSSTNLISQTTDRTWKSTGTGSGSISDPAAGIGTQASGVSVGFVMPFWIPALNGQEVTGAKLTINVISNALTLTNASVYAEVYGARSTTNSSTTTAADYTNATLLVQSWLPLDVDTPLGEHSGSNAALTSWIAAQAGTNGVCYVFLTLKPNMATTDLYKYLYVATADATSEQPQLTLSLCLPEDPYSTLATNALAVDCNSAVNGPGTNWATAFQTVSAAINSPLFSSSNRPVILIKEGVYRELVNLKKSGTADTPLVLTQATTNDRVVISGMKVLDEWTSVSETIYRNTQMGTNLVSNLYADSSRLLMASEPDTGWWRSTNSQYTVSNGRYVITFRDTLNLAGLTNDLTGASVEIWNITTRFFGTYQIDSFNPATGEIICSSLWEQCCDKIEGGIFYRLFNQPSLINRPGDWAVVKEGTTNVIYLNSIDGDAPSAIESPFLSGPLIYIHTQSHIKLNGLELSGAAQKWNANVNDYVKWSAHNLYVINAVDIGIYNCIVHSAEQYGMYIRNTQDSVVANCIIRKNWFGAQLWACTNVNLLGNDIGYNREDSLRVVSGSSYCKLAGNYVHHTSDEQHSDGMQMGANPNSYVSNITLKDNLFLACGQTVMITYSTNNLFENNMMVGSESSVINCGPGAGYYDIFRNTFAFGYYTCLRMPWTDYNVQSNVFFTGQSTTPYSIVGGTNYSGNYNWFYPAPRNPVDNFFMGIDPITQKMIFSLTLSKLQTLNGQEMNSTVGNPGFSNAPVALLTMDKTRMELNSTNTMVLYGEAQISVGDYVEYNFDGILRTVTDMPDAQTIVISPALAESPERAHLILVWGTNTNYTLDLRTSTGRGSDLSIPDFYAGDFNGDGVRDIPPMPAFLE